MATFKLGGRELHKSNSDHCLDLAERGIDSANFRKLRDTRNEFRAPIASTYSQLLSPSCSHSVIFFDDSPRRKRIRFVFSAEFLPVAIRGARLRHHSRTKIRTFNKRL